LGIEIRIGKRSAPTDRCRSLLWSGKQRLFGIKKNFSRKSGRGNSKRAFMSFREDPLQKYRLAGNYCIEGHGCYQAVGGVVLNDGSGHERCTLSGSEFHIAQFKMRH